jgi:hypothetical protein
MAEETNMYEWWTLPERDMYTSVQALLKFIDTDQSYRQNENFKYMRLYGNYDLSNLRAYQYLQAEPSSSIQNRVTLNIIQSMCDTVVSKITKNKPKCTFLTDGGDFSQQRKAKKLTQFIEGQFQLTDFYTKAARAFLDATIFGTGALKIYKNNNQIHVERVFIDEIKIDDNEALYGEPRQMHQKKYIDKRVLATMFPDSKDIILSLGLELTDTYSAAPARDRNLVLVTESWHLKSGPDATDGKHCITILNHTLFSEQYDKEYFPFVFFRWGLRPMGFFGQGLAEQLSGLQLEINKILRTIQVSMHLVSIPKIFVEASSKIVDAHLDNKIGGIIKYAGTLPTEGKLGSIPEELFAHLDRLYSRAYEIAGISQLSATAQKPAGLNSGKALRVFNDLETERFMSVAMRYEKAFMDAAPIMLDLAKEIDADLKEGGQKYSVKVKGRKFLETIKWNEVDMDKDDYVMSIFPTSALSATPAGRLQDIQELIQAGFVNQEDAMKLLDFPDLQSFYNFQTAPGEDIDMLIEKFIDKGEYETPEPYQDLEYGKQKMQKAYLLFKSQGASDDRLELFRRWIEDAKVLQDRAIADMQRMQAQASAAAQAAAAQTAALNQPAGQTTGMAAGAQQISAVNGGAAPSIGEPPIV